MKLVKFKDGTFGIRKLSLFGYEYKDFTGFYWWRNQTELFLKCKTTEEIARKTYNDLIDKGEPIDARTDKFTKSR